MWPKSYRDYKIDDPLIKDQVQPGKAIIGCEMHDINGWGHTYHIPYKHKRRGFFSRLFERLKTSFNSKAKK